MSTISAQPIRKPRRSRKCSRCDRMIDGPRIRAYGRACAGDKPFVIWLCWACGADSGCSKIRAAASQIKLDSIEWKTKADERMRPEHLEMV